MRRSSQLRIVAPLTRCRRRNRGEPTAAHGPGRGAPAWRPVPSPLVINEPSVQYKGEDLDAGRGPGLGCFRFQVGVLVVFIVLTPFTVVWAWPTWISGALLFATIALLLVAGQTIIFLLRLVAADRRGRRRPLASASKTVGELEDDGAAETGAAAAETAAAATEAADIGADDTGQPPPSDEGPVRQ